jgi:hypothetical protein
MLLNIGPRSPGDMVALDGASRFSDGAAIVKILFEASTVICGCCYLERKMLCIWVSWRGSERRMREVQIVIA